MKKECIILIFIFLLLSSSVGQVCAATTVFLTSDNIMGEDNDKKMLNSIKNYVEELSNGEIQVIVDSESPNPGEATRGIESGANVSVNLAAADPGNLLVLAKFAANTKKPLIYVNTGNFDLDTEKYLRRAWDDNYSSKIFAGLNSPGTFLKDAGVAYIQPLKEFPDAGKNGNLDKYSEDVNKYIAKEIVKNVGNISFKNYDNDLVVTHKLDPSKMA